MHCKPWFSAHFGPQRLHGTYHHRQRQMAWKEKLELVRHEMYWVVRWFQGQESEWERIARESMEAGAKAYTEMKGPLYQGFVEDA
ncbi:hypothetical protein PAXRUDRAFT_139899 [Paxillus rubicundulus Ve08.2h10]|uniref:Unplaced genomic scaffold scaffold_198, whole genome shotgun sequence n=1 Tax=Paxillus rubicundulus Ve08.2h10 TaxID=930991 RepID=A0A0D0E9H7_9AGAM|nr:hypothetical protein PAXRUDRAFT_139899 [Paxillus rubicundulus Ve08.2h10]